MGYGRTFDTLTIDHRFRTPLAERSSRTRLSIPLNPRPLSQMVVNLQPCPVFVPVAKVAVHRLPRWKVSW